MLWVDIAVILLLAHYAIKGIICGCKNEIVAIVALMTGIIVAWFFSHNFATILMQVLASATTRLALSFFLLVLLTVTIGKIINWLVTNKQQQEYSAMDRIGGLVLGMAHGWIMMITLVLVAGLTTLPKDRWWRQSKYLPTFQATAVQVKSVLDTKMASSINY